MELMTIEQVAEMLIIKPGVVSEMARTGRIPYIRFGKMYRFDKADIIDWLQKNKRVTVKN